MISRAASVSSMPSSGVPAQSVMRSVSPARSIEKTMSPSSGNVTFTSLSKLRSLSGLPNSMMVAPSKSKPRLRS